MMRSKSSSVSTLLMLFCIWGFASAQGNQQYWQQQADYQMDVAMDVKTFKYTGTQRLVYTNNSPDTLSRVFYHMYFNAFRPGSEMDLRLRSVKDPDPRMVDYAGESRIAILHPTEMGYLMATSLTQDGQQLTYSLEGTVLEVSLAKPILPGRAAVFQMEFDGQVPLQIRRSGRNNKEGVALSMTQWYPKMAEYDFEGWHTHPYIAREFHGVWGNYDVKITLDKNYVVGGTGYIQNPQEVGHGYADPNMKVRKPRGKNITWHFKAPNVHDFMWAADPEYIHDTLQMEDGPTLHFLYKDNPEIKENWKKLQPKTAETIRFLSQNVGPYPYDQFSVIQGGDGGMEYAMGTLITGERSLGSLIGVTVHEAAHSWFYQVLASNESQHAWMDEGFTGFISALCMNEIMDRKEQYPFRGAYNSYYALVKSGQEQPLTTHSDRFSTNRAYSIASYSKGEVFLSQLGYVIGQEKLMATLRRYFDDFKFKHPTPNDLIRTAEKVSGLHLGWYLNDWARTTNTIDYEVSKVESAGNTTSVSMKRIGLMPMPIDILVVYQDGSRESFYTPLRMMRGEKANPYQDITRTVLADWPWAAEEFSFTISRARDEIRAIIIDPSLLMADINTENNIWQSSGN